MHCMSSKWSINSESNASEFRENLGINNCSSIQTYRCTITGPNIQPQAIIISLLHIRNKHFRYFRFKSELHKVNTFFFLIAGTIYDLISMYLGVFHSLTLKTDYIVLTEVNRECLSHQCRLKCIRVTLYRNTMGDRCVKKKQKTLKQNSSILPHLLHHWKDVKHYIEWYFHRIHCTLIMLYNDHHMPEMTETKVRNRILSTNSIRVHTWTHSVLKSATITNTSSKTICSAHCNLTFKRRVTHHCVVGDCYGCGKTFTL